MFLFASDRPILILTKNFCIIIIEGRTMSDNSFTKKFMYRKEYIMYSKKSKKIDIRLTAKEKEEIQK